MKQASKERGAASLLVCTIVMIPSHISLGYDLFTAPRPIPITHMREDRHLILLSCCSCQTTVGCVCVFNFYGFSENYSLRIAFFCRIEIFASHVVGDYDSVSKRDFCFVGFQAVAEPEFLTPLRGVKTKKIK